MGASNISKIKESVLSRRDFLKSIGVIAGSAILAACESIFEVPVSPTTAPRPLPTNTPYTEPDILDSLTAIEAVKTWVKPGSGFTAGENRFMFSDVYTGLENTPVRIYGGMDSDNKTDVPNRFAFVEVQLQSVEGETDKVQVAWFMVEATDKDHRSAYLIKHFALDSFDLLKLDGSKAGSIQLKRKNDPSDPNPLYDYFYTRPLA